MSKIEVNQISSQCGSTLTIGQSGDTVTLASGATQTGFGRTGTVDWCTTAKTAPFTGVSGKGYFVDTTCGAVTVTLPATPTAGDIISIKDYARTASTNAINFCRNGSKMDGVCASTGITTSGDSTTLIYVDGTKGWTSILDNTTSKYGASYITATGGTITTCGDYKIHTFTSDGCFSVSQVGNPAGSTTVDYLVVAGGGGGGASGSAGAGGGGAGGFRLSNAYSIPAPTMSPLANPTNLPVSVTTYPITVGGGGTGGCGAAAPGQGGTSGSSSIFSTITSAGGGGGGGYFCTTGGSGGSGGGGGDPNGPTSNSGGTGNTPPTSPPQGNNGGPGTGPGGCDSTQATGGGGGAGAAGTAGAFPSTGGPGGVGSYLSPLFAGSNGTPGPIPGVKYFAGGGGGRAATTQGTGGAGGGGNSAVTGCPGTVNTGGGGGGGGGPSVGGTGGSGIVIIRYKYQ